MFYISTQTPSLSLDANCVDPFYFLNPPDSLLYSYFLLNFLWISFLSFLVHLVILVLVCILYKNDCIDENARVL